MATATLFLAMEDEAQLDLSADLLFVVFVHFALHCEIQSNPKVLLKMVLKRKLALIPPKMMATMFK